MDSPCRSPLPPLTPVGVDDEEEDEDVLLVAEEGKPIAASDGVVVPPLLTIRLDDGSGECRGRVGLAIAS
jgi:hypothetical protein